jgi:hypothetical protein
VCTIVGTFREMPGLCLHLNQAARLFGLPASMCEVILNDLVAQGTLRRAHDGQYLAAELERPPGLPQPDLTLGPPNDPHGPSKLTLLPTADTGRSS